MKFCFRKILFCRRLKWLFLVFVIFLLPVGYVAYNYNWFGVELVTTTIQPEEIKGKIITLRQLKEDYFLDYHNMFSSTVRKAMEFPEVITLNYTTQYLKLEMEKNQTGKQLMYCIFDNKDNKLIGSIEIREKDPDDVGQFGFWVNENYWGGGRTQEATKLIVGLYFKLHPGRDSFISYVRPWNKRSFYALKKAGFKEIGYTYKDGKPDYQVLEYYKNKGVL